jgi:xylulokinase
MHRWTDLPADARSRLGNPLVPGMAGPLLTWLHKHEAASLNAAAVVTSPKDWLRGRLTGDTTTERSDASATLLWDVVADDWATDALSLTGISRDQLPAVASSHAVVGTADLSDGHQAPAPVVAGAADTAAALVALQATQPPDTWSRSLVINAGTGIQIVRPQVPAEARTDPITHLYADAEGGWYEMLAVQNGGMALSWARSVLDVTWDQFSSLAKASPDGAGGAVFVLAPSNSTARWSSLTPSTGRAQLARSSFEAFAFTIRRGIDMLGGHQGPVLLSGGGAREPWIRQLIADVLDIPVSYLHLRSASAVGAAVLAARGVGMRLPVPATVVEVKPSDRDRQPLDQAYDLWQATVDA